MYAKPNLDFESLLRHSVPSLDVWPSLSSEDRHRKANAGANDISYLKLIKYMIC